MPLTVKIGYHEIYAESIPAYPVGSFSVWNSHSAKPHEISGVFFKIEANEVGLARWLQGVASQTTMRKTLQDVLWARIDAEPHARVTYISASKCEKILKQILNYI